MGEARHQAIHGWSGWPKKICDKNNAETSGEFITKMAEREAAAKAMSQMLAEGSLYDGDFFRDQDFAKKLLCANVFSLDIKTRRVTFKSTVMRNFCKEHPEVWRVGD